MTFFNKIVCVFGARKLFTVAQFGPREVHYAFKDCPSLIGEVFNRLYPFETYEGCKSRHPLIPLPISRIRLVLLEYSSPNIAKPLHAGHLRSTVIGNVLANLYQAAGHSVIRLNFIGDCGAQFAVIGTSLSEEDVQKLQNSSPKTDSHEVILWLLHKYVAQTAKLAPKDGDSTNKDHIVEKEKVDNWHHRLECGDAETKRVWQLIRERGFQDLLNMYQRLGLHFDRFEYESDYVQKARSLAKKLLAENNNRLKFNQPPESEGCFVTLKEGTKSHVFLKSDGSTVYLSRDVSALLQRVESAKSSFGQNADSIHYVVENGQTDHLEVVRKIVCALLPQHRETLNPDHFHIKFGRVHGMSTRKGNAVLLSDILDEAQSRMVKILIDKATTKVDKSNQAELNFVAEKLGVTAVVVNDLKRRRGGDYRFNWDVALDFGADGGIFLQYTHARLCSIERQAGVVIDSNSLLSGVEDLANVTSACNLINHMLQFEDVVLTSLEILEPGPFVRYSLKLAKLTNQCVEDQNLRVKHQEPHIAQPRLVMFKSARHLLASCLNILGLPALTRV